MGQKTHYLKTERIFFRATKRGDKLFELRCNDRDFEEGDIVVLNEVLSGEPTIRDPLTFDLTYILEGGLLGLDSDYCILQLQPVSSATDKQTKDL